MAQISSVNAIHATDVNNDGKIDLVLAGNKLIFRRSLEGWMQVMEMF